MGKKDSKRPDLYKMLMFAAGSAGMLLPRFLNLQRGTGLANAVWIFAFLELVYAINSRRQIIITAAVFCASYCLRFIGIAGIVWLYLAISLSTGLVLFGAFFAYSRIIGRFRHPAATLAFPALWLAVYFIGILIRLPIFTRVDVMFADMNVFLQGERLLGSYGLSFASLWIIALMQYAVRNHCKGAAALGSGIFLLLIIFGIVRLYPNTVYSDTVRVAYTTGPYVGDYLNYSTLPVEKHLASMNNSAREASEQGAEILIYCEEAFEIADSDEETFLNQCCSAAKAYNIHMLVGLDVDDTDDSNGGKGENKLIWISSDGEILGSYLKTKLIPVLESDHVAGNGEIPSHLITVGDRQIKVSYLICYDSNFTGYVKKIDNDTDILFLPSWDWDTVTEAHSIMCCAVAAENHVSILKATYDGISIAVNCDGEIISSTNTNDTGFEHVQVVNMPIGEEKDSAAKKLTMKPPVYGIVAVEIMSILICAVLLYGNIAENSEKSSRNRMYSAIVITCMISLIADAASWILDGCTRLVSVLYISTTLSMVLSFVMSAQYVVYLTEFIKEHRQISFHILNAYICFSAAAVILTIIGCTNGMLFSFENGIYNDGPLYGLYVAVNAITMFFCLTVVLFYRKSINVHDRIATYMYIFIPGLAATANIFIPEFSYAYPATTLSLTVIYVMLQSERADMLEMKEHVSSERAVHDDLTGLLNRRGFYEKLQQVLASDSMTGVIYSDINGLKYANDNFGHEVGDRLLVSYAELLCIHFSREEVFRISGDEFVVILSGLNQDDFTQRVKDFERARVINGKEIASIGSDFGMSRNLNELLKTAEVRMYEQKKEYHRVHPEIDR